MIVLSLGKVVLRGIYALHKLAPVKDERVVLISRQSDAPSLDIQLLRDELLRQDPTVEVVVLCRTLGAGFKAKLSYLLHMIGPQMHALATSRVAVLDSYCIAVSILNHKESLCVIQMWHAMGALKKFAKSILDEHEGSTKQLANAMEMHANYDWILASSEASKKAFAEAFGYDEERFIILPLPRTDLLTDETYMNDKRAEIIERCPRLIGKKVVLYAPTFRKGSRVDEDNMQRFIDEMVLHEDYIVILSPHPNMDRNCLARVVELPEFSTLELLAVCDYFVTDYSAMIYEAALACKPIFLYAYDLDYYHDARGFYLDYDEDLPSRPMRDAKAVALAIVQYEGEQDLQGFAAKYIEPTNRCAERLASFVRDCIILSGKS